MGMGAGRWDLRLGWLGLNAVSGCEREAGGLSVRRQIASRRSGGLGRWFIGGLRIKDGGARAGVEALAAGIAAWLVGRRGVDAEKGSGILGMRLLGKGVMLAHRGK